MERDPQVEAGAIALAWVARPAALFPKLSEQTYAHQNHWWSVQSDYDRDLYRYRASVVLEAASKCVGGLEYAAE